jgi:hypothetical protein
MLVDVYRCAGHGIDIFKLLDDVLPDNGDGRQRLKYLVITHAHDDHITGIGDLYDRYAVEWLWVPQHEDRKQVAKNFGEYQRVVDEHPSEKVKRPQGSRTPLGEKDPDLDLGEDVTVRCFSPPGYIEIDERLTEEEAKQLIHENCLVIKIAYQDASVMLTGDSNLACWERILGYYKGRTEEETAPRYSRPMSFTPAITARARSSRTMARTRSLRLRRCRPSTPKRWSSRLERTTGTTILTRT